MDDKDKLVKMRDTFRDTADIIDEMITLDEREDNGEEVQKDIEAAAGRFLMKLIELQSLSQ